MGSHEFIGEGRTRQAARHNAAMKALQALRDEPIPERPPQVKRFFFFFFVFFVFIIITLLVSKINCRRHAGRPLAGACRHISCATSALRNVMKTRTHPDTLTKRHFLSGLRVPAVHCVPQRSFRSSLIVSFQSVSPRASLLSPCAPDESDGSTPPLRRLCTPPPHPLRLKTLPLNGKVKGFAPRDLLMPFTDDPVLIFFLERSQK